MKYSKEEKETAKESLSFLKPGDTIYTELLSVSRSGMTRHIKPIVIEDDAPRWIGGYVGKLLDERVDDNGGVVMGGCGMDMGFALVYNLSSVLFPGGFNCLGEGNHCPASDHANGSRDYSKTAHHKSGGYALRHRWL